MKEASRPKIKDVLVSQEFGKDFVLKGWVRTKRGNNKIAFIALNDGTTINSIQVVIDVPRFDGEMIDQITTGACIAVNGTLVESMGKGQRVEIQAKSVEVYGPADPEIYPLQKKGHSMEFLREIAHLRPRTNTFGAILRIRHHLAYAIHKYYNDEGFYYMHTPIITGSDAEGAGDSDTPEGNHKRSPAGPSQAPGQPAHGQRV